MKLQPVKRECEYLVHGVAAQRVTLTQKFFVDVRIPNYYTVNQEMSVKFSSYMYYDTNMMAHFASVYAWLIVCRDQYIHCVYVRTL